MNPKETAIRVLKSMRGNRLRYVIGILGMSVFILIFQVLIAYLFFDLFDELATGEYDTVIRSIIPYIIGIFVIICIIPFFAYMINKAVVYTSGNIRKTAFNTLITLPVGYFKQSHSANTSSIITNDIS